MSRIYVKLITAVERYVPPKLMPLWNHPAAADFLQRICQQQSGSTFYSAYIGHSCVNALGTFFRIGNKQYLEGDSARNADKLSINFRGKGPKTIFFWSPWFKWGLVIASLGDLNRPAELVSARQSAALAFTGAIWSRYCLVIYPVNYNLFACNVFVGCTGCYQTLRALRYQYKTPEEPKEETENLAALNLD